MKYTLCVTRRCNLDCAYCYIRKDDQDMPLPLAKRIIEFVYAHTPPGEKIQLGFFGGEPLLRFSLVQKIMEMIRSHPAYDGDRVEVSLVTNGTVLSDSMIEFIRSNNIVYCLSCDGPPSVQNAMRKFRDGRDSARFVEEIVRRAKKTLPCVLVNAVYHPRTFRQLPEVIRYFSSLGLRKIYLNPDFSAPWSVQDIEALPDVYRQLGKLYAGYFLNGDPHFISLIDSKLAVILQGGYKPGDRCRMGTHEFAFGPSGNIYPCERLIGSDDGAHSIGSMDNGTPEMPGIRCPGSGGVRNAACRACGIQGYCMNWCGCSNFFSTGNYRYVGPFLCASERAALAVAFDVFSELRTKAGPQIMEHLAGIRVCR